MSDEGRHYHRGSWRAPDRLYPDPNSSLLRTLSDSLMGLPFEGPLGTTHRQLTGTVSSSALLRQPLQVGLYEMEDPSL
jgi:hypothetical protein